MESNLLEFRNILSDNVNKEFTLFGAGWDNDSTYIINKVYPTRLIILDKEDIQYFTNKYLPKLQEEMESKINKIKQEYGQTRETI